MTLSMFGLFMVLEVSLVLFSLASLPILALPPSMVSQKFPVAGVSFKAILPITQILMSLRSVNKNWVQIGINLAGAVSISAYAFTVTLLLCVIIDYIPFLGLRSSEEGEVVGVDLQELGEFS